MKIPSGAIRRGSAADEGNLVRRETTVVGAQGDDSGGGGCPHRHAGVTVRQAVGSQVLLEGRVEGRGLRGKR